MAGAPRSDSWTLGPFSHLVLGTSLVIQTPVANVQWEAPISAGPTWFLHKLGELTHLTFAGMRILEGDQA